MDEFVHVRFDGNRGEEPIKKLTLIFNFKVKILLFSFLRCILLVTKVKFCQGTIGRKLIVVLKNGNKVCRRVRANSDFTILDSSFANI